MGAGQSTYDLNDNQRAHLSPRMQAGTSTAIGDDMEASGSGVSTTTAGSAARSAWSYKATDQKGGGSNGDHQTDRQTSSTAQAKSKVRIDGGHSVRYSESYPVDVSDAIGLGAVTNAVTMGAMLPPPWYDISRPSVCRQPRRRAPHRRGRSRAPHEARSFVGPNARRWRRADALTTDCWLHLNVPFRNVNWPVSQPARTYPTISKVT